MKQVIVIGGGLAGVEAAWQAARAGAHVRLFEMRLITQTLHIELISSLK